MDPFDPRGTMRVNSNNNRSSPSNSNPDEEDDTFEVRVTIKNKHLHILTEWGAYAITSDKSVFNPCTQN